MIVWLSLPNIFYFSQFGLVYLYTRYILLTLNNELNKKINK